MAGEKQEIPAKRRSRKPAAKKANGQAGPAQARDDGSGAVLDVLVAARMIAPPDEKGGLTIPIVDLARVHAGHAVSAPPGAQRDVHLTLSLICLLLRPVG